MRKIFLFLSMVVTCGYAQVDMTSPFIWVEKEVVDTTKAVEMAKVVVGEENTKLQSQISLLTSLKEQKKKKVKAAEDIQLLQEIAKKYDNIIIEQVTPFVQSSRTFTLSYSSSPTDRVLNKLKKGKIDNAYYDAFDDILKQLSSELKDEDTYAEQCFADVVNPLPMKTIKVKVDNPNYRFRWFDSSA